MKKTKNNDIIESTNQIIKLMREMLDTQIEESAGVSNFFENLREKLPQIYLRPNSVIDAGRYSMNKIESALADIGFEFRKEMEDKFHYFNGDTSISVYLNPTNRKITFTP
jgi:hypothetical protein